MIKKKEFTHIHLYGEIFDFNHNGGIEANDSNFNIHRIDVIKYSIERNLSVAISNYNNYSDVSVDFQMPKLKDTDWDKIIDNISIISFLQGMNIGGKVYNGYSIITNTKNSDVVTEDSIYIKTKDNIIYRVTESGLENKITNGAVGIFNVDVERRTGENLNGITIYYYPKYGTLSYDSIVTQNNVKNKSEITNTNLLKIYYTALGRERYCMYREKLEITKIAPYGRGDINYNGVVDNADAQLCVNHLSGSSTLVGLALKRADVNGDGKVTMEDAQRIVQYINSK